MQDALRSNLEATIIPAFEQSCKIMFDHVDVAFQKGMMEHTNVSQKLFESTNAPLTLTLRVCILCHMILMIHGFLFTLFNFRISCLRVLN